MRKDAERFFKSDGSPKYLRCYETKRKPVLDRFTIVFAKASGFLGEAAVGWAYYATAAGSPRVFYQRGSAPRREFHASGSRVAFSSLPPRLRDAVLAEYRELWGIA